MRQGKKNSAEFVKSAEKLFIISLSTKTSFYDVQTAAKLNVYVVLAGRCLEAFSRKRAGFLMARKQWIFHEQFDGWCRDLQFILTTNRERRIFISSAEYTFNDWWTNSFIRLLRRLAKVVIKSLLKLISHSSFATTKLHPCLQRHITLLESKRGHIIMFAVRWNDGWTIMIRFFPSP